MATELNILGGVTSNSDEINLLDGASAGNINNGKTVVYGSNGEINAKTLKIDSVAVSVGANKINLLENVTSDIQQQINNKLIQQLRNQLTVLKKEAQVLL